MPDMNDVVRHVILRVIVDADTLGAELGKARAQLKGLEDSEKAANQRRIKSFEQVTRAVGRYNEALKNSETVGQRVADTSVKSAKEAADSHERSAKAVKQETDALVSQGREADRQASAAQARQAKEKTNADAAAKRAHAQAQQELADELTLDALQKKVDGEQAARDDAAAKRSHEHAKRELADELVLDALQKRIAADQKAADTASTAAATREHNLAVAREEKLRAEAKKTSDQATATRAKAINDARIKQAESTAGISRRDRTTDAGISRADTTAEAARVEAKNRSNAQIERADAEAATRIVARQKESNDKRANNQRVADAQFIREARKTADELLKSQQTLQDGIDTTRSVNASKRSTTTSQAETADLRKQTAGSVAQNALDKTLADSASRRAKSLQDQETHLKKQNLLTTQQVILEQRALEIVDRRSRAEEVAAARRLKGVSALRAALTAGLQDPLRAAADADPDTRVTRRRQVTTSFDQSYAESRAGGRSRAASAVSGARSAFDPSNFTRGVGPAISLWEKLTERIAGAHKALKSESSGGGGAFGRTLQGVSGMADGLLSKLGPLSRTMFSFRGVILAVITAFGPLVAIMGAVGGAALGLASNFVALAGSLLALPGLIGAAVAGFGALAVVMGPMSNVFKAFGAAQKAASDGLSNSGKAAKDAANALVDAQRAAQDAERAHQRAAEDQPRAERRLSEARKQATRDIQDYRLALQKLKFDQEGAELGVEGAEQAYRRALADPTANNLQRKQARHDVVGAMFDQRDQQVSQGRLVEDANEAERRGVEGSDAVVEAKRAIEDANRALEDSVVKLTRANEDLQEAQKDQAAGGAAARKANDELEAQLAKLGPKTRKVVEGMLALDDAFKAMQKRISEEMFGPLADDTDKFADVLKNLEAFLTPAATALGKLGHAALTLFTNPEWKAFFAKQGEESGYILQQLGDAALAAANGFRSVVEVARPFTRFVVDGILGMAQAFEKFATSEKGRKSIEDFLANSRRRMSELWPILKDIVAGLGGFYTALNTPFKDDSGKVLDFTSRINEGLGGIAKTFRKIGEAASDEGGGFMQWLEDVGPLIKDVTSFIGDLATSFATMAADPDNIKEAKAILENLSTKVLPALVAIFDKISESGGVSKLISAFGSALTVLSDFLENGGTTTLSVFFDILEKIGKSIEFLTDVIPGFSSVLAVLTTVLATLAASAIFAKIFQLDKLFKILRFARNASADGGGVTGVVDATRDKLLGRTPGTTSGAHSGGSSSGGGIDLNNDLPRTASPTANAVLPSLGRIEGHLRTLIAVMRTCCASGGPGGRGGAAGRPVGPGGTSPHTPPYSRDTGRPDVDRPGGVKGVKGDAPPYTRRNIRGRGIAGLVGGVVAGGLLSGGLGGDDDYGVDPASMVDPSMAVDPRRDSTTIAEPGPKPPSRPKPVRGKGIANLIKGGAPKFGRALARGATGGPASIAASLALAFGGDAAVNKFVRDDEDAASMSRGLGAVATGAGIGGLVGSVVPGVGTAIGGAVGGAVGGAYSLVKDPNLRDFVGGKISSGASAAGSAVGSIFTGKDAEGKEVSTGDRVKTAAAAVTGPAALLGGTDVGKSIGDGLKSAGTAVTDFLENTGSGIGTFFTETLPTFIEDNLVEPMTTFFTETLPGLPGKAFHAFNIGVGKLLGFLIRDLPREAKKLFTETIPDLGKDAWEAVQENLFDPMVTFITKTIPDFFTETIPDWFDAAGEFLQEDVIDPIYNFITGIPAFFTETIPQWFDSLGETLETKVFEPVKSFITGIPAFFTETIPEWFASLPEWFGTHVKDPLINFFTVTLPDTFKKIPGFLYDNFAKPIGNFFAGLAGHVGDFLTGSWDWVKGVFSSATADVKEGYESGDPRKRMSGGLIEGVYSGIEDNVRTRTTAGEFVVRRGAVEQPHGKTFLHDYNEGRVTAAQFYAGLSAQATPNVMSLAPTAPVLGGGVGNADYSRSSDFTVGDVTINNPVREPSDRSMRRALQIAAIRHRR